VSDIPSGPPRQRLTLTHWLILIMASIGFAFDIYVLLVMPLINRPALAQLLHVNPDTTSGTKAILDWTGYISWSSAACGGIFGLLGGYLTDLFGRRRILTWSILLYAVSAVASGLATSPEMLLVFRCTTFIGVCVEFVAAVAWLAELFPNQHQRETVLGYTQAFSSAGGLLATGSFILVNAFADWLPAIYDGHDPWRYTLISGVIPAIPLIIIRPFLPESPEWQRKRAEGTLKRASILELFQPAFRRTSLVSAALFACVFGAAFGAIQLTPQIVPGLVPELRPLTPMKDAYEGSLEEPKLDKLHEQADAAKKKLAADPENPALKEQAERAQKQYGMALGASKDEQKREELRGKIHDLEHQREATVGRVQLFQELGGLVGRFALAWLAVRILSRRKLLWTFQVPGLIVLPVVFAVCAAGNLGEQSLAWLRPGIFVVGFLTVAQMSFFGNYLPRVYPIHLRGTGESFAANVGGRMFGTTGQFAATQLGVLLLTVMPSLPRHTGIAYAAAAVGFGVFAIGTVLTFWLPEPKEAAVAADFAPEPKERAVAAH
jgi:MFS family permease